jgi:hypothetical protein
MESSAVLGCYAPRLNQPGDFFDELDDRLGPFPVAQHLVNSYIVHLAASGPRVRRRTHSRFHSERGHKTYYHRVDRTVKGTSYSVTDAKLNSADGFVSFTSKVTLLMSMSGCFFTAEALSEFTTGGRVLETESGTELQQIFRAMPRGEELNKSDRVRFVILKFYPTYSILFQWFPLDASKQDILRFLRGALPP